MASNYIKAYKIYLLENATHNNLKKKNLWSTDSAENGELFELTETKINKLINNAIKQKFPFATNTLFLNKSHGKGIVNNLRHIEMKFRDGAFTEFFKLFNVKSFEEFLNDPELMSLYLQKVDENYTPQLYKHSITYLFQFWSGEDIGRALITVEIKPNGSWGQLNIQYFKQSEINNKWLKIPKSEILEVGEDDFVRQNGNRKEVYISKNNPTYLSIHSADGTFIKDSFFCNYCISYNGETFSGVGILEHVESENLDIVINAVVNPSIYNILFQRRSFLRFQEEKYAPDPEFAGFSYKSEFINYGKEYCGVYKGYYLDSEFKNTEKTIRTLLLEIDPSGKISVNDGEVGELTGFCSLAGDKQIMYITCDFKFKVGGIPRFQIIIDMPQKPLEEIELEGVYGGYSRSNNPYIGLILLKRLNGIKNLKDALAQKINQPKAFKKEENIGKAFQEHFSDRIIKYFIDARFYNSPFSCINNEILNKFVIKGTNNYDGPKGVYYAYSSSSRQIGIVRYPIYINSDGVAKIKTADDIIETGSAIKYHLNNFLILNFYSNQLLPNARPTKGIFVFRTSHQKKIKMVPGISLRINDDEKVQAKREFLVLQEYPDSQKNEESDQSLFDKLKFDIILPERANSEYRVSHELLTVLLGREYNLMVLTNEINKREKILQRQEFNKLYFNQAMFEYQKSKREFLKKDAAVIRKVTVLLKLALQHGVYTEQLFDEHLDEYCKVYALPIKEIGKDIRPVYLSLISEYRNQIK